MTAPADMLRASEAAHVARVSLRDVNRVIDERILPAAFVSNDNGRQVRASACGLIAFYVESAKRLTADERMSAISRVTIRLFKLHDTAWTSLLDEDWTLRDEVLTIDLGPYLRRTAERLDALHAARAMVTTSPEILGGVPVVRGTRVPVHDVAASVAAGASTDRLREAYPSLDAEQVRLACIYAEANPQRGRPRRAGETPDRGLLIEDRLVPRRRKAG